MDDVSDLEDQDEDEDEDAEGSEAEDEDENFSDVDELDGTFLCTQHNKVITK